MKVFWLDRKALRQAIRRAVRELTRSRPEVCQVVLFGSVAEGRDVPSSDVDILLVLEQSRERFIDRPLRYRKFFEGVGLGVDLFAYTRAEIEHGDIPLAREAIGKGTCLFVRR